MIHYAKNIFCIILASLSVLIFTSCGRSDPSPNIVFILVDDLGWHHLSSNGNPVFETPHIDRLAEMGTSFSQAYSSPLCTPTRAALMTGKYPGRLRMTRVGDDYDRGKADRPAWYNPASRQKPGDPWDELSVDVIVDLPFEEVTLAELAREAGYRTGFIGKWHLGFNEYYPEHHGFEWVFGGDHWSDYFAPWEGHRTSTYEAEPGEHITRRIAREAIGFIERNKDEKFLLCLWNYGIHTPVEGEPDLVDYYDSKIEDQSVYHPVYGAMGQSVDDCVGEVIRCLEENDLMENTLIVFMSDNGPVTGQGTAGIYDPRLILNRNTANDQIVLSHEQHSLEQQFSCKADTFQVGFALAESGLYLSEASGSGTVLMAEILEAQSPSRVLKTLRIPAERLAPGSWQYMLLDRPVESGSYLLRLTLVGGAEGTVVPLKSTGDNSIPGASLKAGGEELTGDLYIKCLPSANPPPRYVSLCSSGPFRGRKIMLYEGGIRVPLIFTWKGVIEPGKEITTPAAHIDMLPTLSDFMGRTVTHSVDGVSLHDLILNGDSLENRELHWHYPHYMYSNGGEAIRDDRYKYIEFYVDGRKELYDLELDPGEQNNLMEEMPETAERLKKRMYEWLDEIDASMPAPAVSSDN